jgi:FkbM family methyltransferase
VPEVRKFPSPDVDGLDVAPQEKRRVLMTVSCHDSDAIPKVENAGSFIERDGKELQVMHNGLLVERGCYYGPWTDEVIRATGGHHEPQEELVFYKIAERLAATEGQKCSIEFGSFWAYYTMWFAHNFPGSRSIALEPDPAYLDTGRRNAALNGLDEAITFGQGAVGSTPGSLMSFKAESDGKTYDVMQYDLASTMAEFDLSHVDLLMVDIQGFEEVLLPRALAQFGEDKVRFLIVSTHHHLISGNPTTHQDVLKLLVDAGAHVIVEHTVSESYSGDGLIAVSFDPQDSDFTVEISYNRASKSLFGGLEPELAVALRKLSTIREELASQLEDSAAAEHAAAQALAVALATAEHEKQRRLIAEQSLEDLRQTRVVRYWGVVRSAYSGVRSRVVKR